MDTLKKAKDKYKLATSVIDLATVLSNKAMELINNKVLSNAERVNKEIAAGNIDKVKKFGTVYVDVLKNYMTIASTMNLLIADSHSATYERKTILRALLKLIDAKTSKNDEKVTYVLGKIISFEKHVENSAKYLVTLSNAIRPVVGGNETAPSETPQPIKNLADVSGILLEMSRKIEMALAEIRLVDKSLVKLLEKKGGSLEHLRTNEFQQLHSATRDKLIKGGVDVDARRIKQKVKIIGGAEDDVYIGGSALDQDLEVKTIWVESYKHDLLAMRENPKYKSMMQKRLFDTFKVGSAEELESFAKSDDADFVDKISKDSGLDSLLQKQIESILVNGKLQQFLAYYVRHRNKYAPSKTELKSEAFVMGDEVASFSFSALTLKDDYINLNLTLTEDASIGEKLQYIVDFVKIVMDALNKVDICGIENKARICFANINEIRTAEQLNIVMEEIDALMADIEKNKEFLLERKRIKMEILKLADELIEPEGIFVKPKKPILNSHNIEDIANHALEKQLAFRQILGAAEQTFNDQANTLANLFKSMDSLASTENLDTCLYKSINFTCAAVYVDVLPKVLAKRFAGKPGAENRSKIETYHKYLADKTKLPSLYTKADSGRRLDLSAVRKLAIQLVDPSE